MGESKIPAATPDEVEAVPAIPEAAPGVADEDAAAFAREAAEAAAEAVLAAEEAAAGQAEAGRLAGEAAQGKAAAQAAIDAAAERPTAEEEALGQAGLDAKRDPATLDDVAPADIGEEEEPQGSFEKLAAKAAKLTAEQVRHVLHAILFVSDKALTVEQLKAATGIETKRLNRALDKLSGELREGVSGVVLSEVAGAWQLRTAPEAGEYVRRFLQVKPRRLTRAALETLAIVAYRQPVTRPEVEDIRGVDCGAVMKALLDWKLVKILGRKDEVGRPILYGTTREFLEFFQLRDLASLPTLREFHELTEESRQIVEEELGPEAAAIAGTVDELGDPAFLEAEQERVAQSEAALAELEQAMADTEEKAGSLAAAIAPKPKPEGDAPPPAEG